MAEFDDEPFPPPGVDLEHPSVARVYDYYLGGTANWVIDRELGDRALRAFPELRHIAKSNRLFLHKVVRHLVKAGVRQFIDIGSGVPTMGHAHQIAESVAPGEVHVAYVDYEPVAVAHSKNLLQDNGDPNRHVAIHADLRDPDRLWDKVRESGAIDLDEPIALLLIAVLHVQQPPPNGTGGDDLAPKVVARYRDLLPPRSYLAISHLTNEGVPPEFGDKLRQLKIMYEEAGNPIIWRSHDEIAEFFGNFSIVDPGLTWTPLWHPELADNTLLQVDFPTPNTSAILAGVARKS